MAIATLTSKGQLTLPKSIREKAHLESGIKMEVQLNSDGTILLEPLTLTVADGYGLLRRKGLKGLSRAASKKRLAKAFRKEKA